MKRRSTVALLVLLAGCPSPAPMMGNDAGARACSIDLDCDDGIACTLDSCGVGGRCESLPIDELCPAGQSCAPGVGCRAGRSCTSTAECDDGIACTVEQCVAGGTCRITPLDARCAEPTPVCDPAMGCVAASGCASDAECDDGVACTLDACGVDRACVHDAIDARCAAGERCGSRGCYTPRPCTTAADCQDGDFCNGAEVCMSEFGCAPAPTPRMCADTDPCTMDRCDPDLDMCVFACDRSRPECMCPVGGSCGEGTFALTGSPLTFSCYFGMTGFDFRQVRVAFDGPDLVITPTALYSAGITMQSVTDLAPSCPDFDAELTIGGGCVEHYRLAGTFTDLDHFTGTLEWWYEKVDGFSCTISGCMGRMSAAVTGTRM